MPLKDLRGSGMEALRLWRQVTRSHDDRLATADERRLGGRIGGGPWLSIGLTLLVRLPMPGERIDEVGLVAAIGALAGVGGAGLLLAVPWERAPRWLSHLSTALVPVVVLVVQVLSGGDASPAHEYLRLVVVYAAFFFPPVPAIAYAAACS